MQDDKMLLSEKVSAGKRTYFLDVKENRQGYKILKITESRKNDGEFIRHSVMVFEEDIHKFLDALDKVKSYILNELDFSPREFSKPDSESIAPSKEEKEEDLSF